MASSPGQRARVSVVFRLPPAQKAQTKTEGSPPVPLWWMARDTDWQRDLAPFVPRAGARMCLCTTGDHEVTGLLRVRCRHMAGSSQHEWGAADWGGWPQHPGTDGPLWTPGEGVSHADECVCVGEGGGLSASYSACNYGMAGSHKASSYPYENAGDATQVSCNAWGRQELRGSHGGLCTSLHL